RFWRAGYDDHGQKSFLGREFGARGMTTMARDYLTARICRAAGAAEVREGILTDSFEVAQSRDGLPRSKIGGSCAAA
ncbi:MAG TPA: hypothetical protein DCG70_02825, partial [Lachnoclostridium sp.]|nr:hypothetical protein [Lachnoclostridium sp.]